MSAETIATIRNITLADVIRQVLNLDQDDIQDDVFFWKDGMKINADLIAFSYAIMR